MRVMLIYVKAQSEFLKRIKQLHVNRAGKTIKFGTDNNHVFLNAAIFGNGKIARSSFFEPRNL